MITTGDIDGGLQIFMDALEGPGAWKRLPATPKQLLRDNASLDAPNPDGHGYAVFGKVVSGMDTITKIKSVQTGSKGPYQNVPATPVVITSASVVK